VSGVGPAHPAPFEHLVHDGLLDLSDDHGRERPDREMTHGRVECGQDRCGGLVEGVGDAAKQVAQLAHRGHCCAVVAGDVADDEAEFVAGGEECVVPVAADLGVVRGRAVAGGDL
jgi:hypothetical protein